MLSDHNIIWFNISVDHIQRVTMINCLEKLLHISGGALFCKCLILLLHNFLVHWHSFNIFHDEVDVFLIIVSFVILDNVGVVQLVENCNLLHDHVDVVCQFDLVEHFDSDLETFIVLVLCLEDFSEGSGSEHLCVVIDVVVLFELPHALLSRALPHHNLLPCRLGSLLGLLRILCFGLIAPHVFILKSKNITDKI